MMYASTKESFKRALSGLSGDELQANDEADLEENEMLKTVSKGTAALKA